MTDQMPDKPPSPNPDRPPLPPEISQLKEPKDYLAFFKNVFGKNIDLLAEKKPQFLPPGLTAEAIKAALSKHLEQLFNVHENGGAIGYVDYLPNDMLVHTICHSLYQTALTSDVVTTIALSDNPQLLPSDAGGERNRRTDTHNI